MEFPTHPPTHPPTQPTNQPTNPTHPPTHPTNQPTNPPTNLIHLTSISLWAQGWPSAWNLGTSGKCRSCGGDRTLTATTRFPVVLNLGWEQTSRTCNVILMEDRFALLYFYFQSWTSKGRYTKILNPQISFKNCCDKMCFFFLKWKKKNAFFIGQVWHISPSFYPKSHRNVWP